MYKLGKLTPKQTRSFGYIRAAVLANRHILLNETFVAIDPSCASQSSKPGYAIYQGGEFVEGGVLQIKYHPQLAYRLQAIRELLAREIVPHVKLLVIEETPVVSIRSRKSAEGANKTYMNAGSIASLKMACGVTMGIFPVGTPIIRMDAHVWQKLVHNAGMSYVKGDDTDARWIGWAAIHIAQMGDN